MAFKGLRESERQCPCRAACYDGDLFLHKYLLAFLFHISRHEHETATDKLVGTSFWVFLVSAMLFIFMFLFSGFKSVPRRWAEHLNAWVPYDQWAALFGLIVLLAVTPKGNVTQRIGMLGALGFLEGASIAPLIDLAIHIDPRFVFVAIRKLCSLS